MCGILGVPRKRAERLESALESMRWRGPDSGVIAEMDGYRLGVRRLAITDPDADQPICSGPPGRGLTLVFNGSLAYPARLRRRLEAKGLRPGTGNDAELVLLAYRDQGIEGLRRLQGPFALALMDDARSELILARDAFGEKPLFYSPEPAPGPGQAPDKGGYPCFASTIKALRILQGEMGSDLPLADAQAVASRGWVEWGAQTLGLDMREFPRACVAVFALDAAPVFYPLEEDEPRREAWDSALETLLLRSVEGRLHGEPELGLLLSGGLDSACLALLLRRLDRPALCLSLDLEGMVPESIRAAEVARHLDLPHHVLSVGPEILDDLEGLIRKTGLPLADASLLATHRICKQARSLGLGVLLSGEGGDELFLGYRRQRAGPWLGLAQGLLPGPSRLALSRLAHGLSRKSWGAGLRFVHALGREAPVYADLWSLASPVDLDALFADAAQTDAARYAGPLSDGQLVGAPLVDERRISMTAGREQAVLSPLVQEELNGYLAYDLCPKLDCASLAAGIEARAPFLDTAILHRRRRHPAGRFESQGKGEIREILAQVLPARLRGGPKRGFGIPLHRWLPRWSRARTLLAETPDLPWSRSVALAMLDELAKGRGAHRAPLIYHLLILAIHLEDRRRLA